MIVTAVALFPKLRLSMVVTKVSATVKSSSCSILLSRRVEMEEHISAPSPDPGENVRN